STLQVGLSGTATAGAKSGSVVVNYVTDGTGTSGLASESVGSGTVSVTGTVYRKAVGSVAASVNLGTIRVGGAFASGAVVVSNGAAADGFSDDLLAAVSTVGSEWNAGGNVLLAAGSSNATGLNVGYSGSTATAGVVSGTAFVTYTSRGQSGTGLGDVAADVASGTVSMVGKIYRLAQAGLSGGGSLNLGNIRAGSVFGSGTLVVTNTALADGYSDLLRVEQGSTAGFTVVGGSQTLAAGGSGSFAVGFAGGAPSVGVQSGTLTVGYTSVGQAGTGLADVGLGSGTITVSGTVWRAGSGVLGSTSVNLGAVREGQAFGTTGISVSNGAANDGFSEKLNASVGTLSGTALGSGSVSLLGAGQSDTTTLQVGLSGTATVGVKSGSVVVNYLTDGTGTSGLASEAVGSGTVSVTGTVYRLAEASLIVGGTLDLGRIHVGGTFESATLEVWNQAAGDGFSDLLRVEGGSLGSGLTLGGTSLLLSAAQSGTLSVGYQVGVGVLGGVGGSLQLGYTSVGQAGTGLADAGLGSQTVQVSGWVYSGQGVWTGGSGLWMDLGNWSAGGGRPGLDGALSRGVDSAVFESASPLGVTLPSQKVELARLEFGGMGGVTLLAPLGGGGSLSMSGSARMDSSGGNHAVDVPVELVQTLTASVGEGSKLTLGGTLSGAGGIVKLGGGTLVLGAVNTNVGQTWVTAGRLELGIGARLGSGGIDLSAGTELAFRLDSDITIPNTITGLGMVLSLNPVYNVYWNGGTTAAGVGSVTVKPGTTFEYVSGSVSGTGMLTVNAGTLRVSAAETGAVLDNRVLIAGTASFAVESGASMVLSGSVRGSGTLRKDLPGTLVLSGTNDYFGGTEVVVGTLEIQGSTALGTGGVRVDEPASLVVNVPRLVSMGLPNAVSGEGELVKTGAGVLQLSGTNTQVRGTRVQEGVLALEDASALGQRLTMEGGTLALNGVSAVNQAVDFAAASKVQVVSGSARFTGGLSGNGDFIKDGVGTLMLSGSGALLGNAIVQQGTLKVTNAALLAQVPTLVVGNSGADQATTTLDIRELGGGLQLSAGQRLKGRGVLMGAVRLDGAALAPGNSIDVQRVQGNLTLSNATYEAEYNVLQAGKSDRVEVVAAPGYSGTVTLQAGVWVVPIPEVRVRDFAPHRFTIVQAEGGVDGRFAGAVQSALLRARLIYGDEAPLGPGNLPVPVTGVDLEVQRIAAESVGGVGSLGEVGRGLDLVLATGRPEFGGLQNALDGFQTEAEVRAVLQQLNPVGYAELYRMGVMRLMDVQKPVVDRLNTLGAASVSGGAFEVLSAAAGGPSEWSAWTTGYGGATDVEADPARGFGGYSRSVGGNVSGVELRSGRLTLGLMGALGSGGAQFGGPTAQVRSEHWHVGAYAGLPLTRRLFADAAAFYGEDLSEIKRVQSLPDGVLSSRGKVNGQEWLLQAGVGMQLAPQGGAWTLVPTARLAYAGVRQAASAEDGAGAFNLRTDSQTHGTLLSRVTLEGAREWRVHGMPIRLSGNVNWTHDFAADPRRLGVRWAGAPEAGWGLSGVQGRADALRMGVALEFALSDRKTLRLSGEHEFFRRVQGSHFGASLTIGF
ncbi:MAG: hypothetical protein RLZZ244_543, partial [Verrucomicrobiota bacterium]